MYIEYSTIYQIIIMTIRIMKFLKRRFWTFIELLSENQERSTFSERKRAYSDSVKNGTISVIKKKTLIQIVLILRVYSGNSIPCFYVMLS